MRDQVRRMAKALNVVGLMNTQFAIKGNDVYVLEVNPRASRTVPFVSKAIGRPLAKVAARCMVKQSLVQQQATEEVIPDYYAVKEAVFPFIKFPGVDPILGPEMKSTGEVMGVGKTFAEAFGKAQRAAGENYPTSGVAFVSVREADRRHLPEIGAMLKGHGFKIVATRGTARELQSAGIACEIVNKIFEGRPTVVDMIKNEEIDLIINTTEGEQSTRDSFAIRREALQRKITYTTTIAGARALCLAIGYKDEEQVYRLQDLHKRII
jgi:carbamoyl-phosphate synthase large subunit